MLQKLDLGGTAQEDMAKGQWVKVPWQQISGQWRKKAPQFQTFLVFEWASF